MQIIDRDLMMAYGEQTLTPHHIVESYGRAYRKVHGRYPRVRHVAGQWYCVGDETVHRLTLMTEIKRLSEEARQLNPFAATPNRSVVQRLIARLRTL